MKEKKRITLILHYTEAWNYFMHNQVGKDSDCH